MRQQIPMQPIATTTKHDFNCNAIHVITVLLLLHYLCFTTCALLPVLLHVLLLLLRQVPAHCDHTQAGFQALLATSMTSSASKQ
jgi:hypothetical protein